jgi:hypothetical protein
MSKKKSQKQTSEEVNHFDQARLEIDRERLKIEETKTQLERRLINKHFGAILAAFVSFCALLVSIGQIYINKHLGDQNTQTLRDYQQRQSQAQQDHIALIKSLKEIEQETRATDNSLKLAQFLVDNQTELLSADESKRKRMETILFATFDPRVIVPVLERLKGVQVSSHTQDKLESLLNRARELKIQNDELQVRNESPQQAYTRSSVPIGIPTKTKQSISLINEASPRVALVIGNRDYAHAPLRNSINDAQDMAKALGELGFDVIYNENANQKAMKQSIRAFGEKLRSRKGIGLFYYSGHGVQVKGSNYLIPIDAKVESEEEIEYEGVDTGFVIAQMESADNPMNVIILDACRNNPFASYYRSLRSYEDGLAQMSAPRGTLIAYATAPGSRAIDAGERNGLYTQELLKNMRLPGLTVEEVFKLVRISVSKLTGGKQIPWESSSLIGDFYFLKDDKTSASQESMIEADRLK